MLEAYKWFQLSGENGDEDAGKQAAALRVTMTSTQLESAIARYHEFKDSHLAEL